MSANAKQSLAVLGALACAALLAGLALSIVADAFVSGAISVRISRGGESWVLTRTGEPLGFYLFVVLHALIALFSGGFGAFICVLFLRRR